MEPRILPFYMTYPMQQMYGSQQELLQDYEYFQQIYPTGARLLQEEIVKTLTIMDYEGSLLYDEFPDRYALMRLAQNIIVKIRKKMEVEKQEIFFAQDESVQNVSGEVKKETQKENITENEKKDRNIDKDEGISKQEQMRRLLQFEGIEDYAYLVLLGEVWKRRHKKQPKYWSF